MTQNDDTGCPPHCCCGLPTCCDCGATIESADEGLVEQARSILMSSLGVLTDTFDVLDKNDQHDVEERLAEALAHFAGSSSIATLSAMRTIATERARQVSVEGWTAEHDDEHPRGELALAAAAYAIGADQIAPGWPIWPWALRWWKPGDRLRNMEKAGALIVAEIERIERKRVLCAAEGRTIA